MVFGPFEDFTYVDDFGVTVPAGHINNGPPPSEPGGPPRAFFGNAEGHETGWHDDLSAFSPPYAIFSNSTTTGVTEPWGQTSNAALKIVPGQFGGPSTVQIPLAVNVQLMPDPLGDETFDAVVEGWSTRTMETFLALDVTWDPAEWTYGAFQEDGRVRIHMYMNQGGENAQQWVNKVGFIELGRLDPQSQARLPFDGGNFENPGSWDPVTFPAVHTRTLFYSLSNWEDDQVPGLDRDLQQVVHAAAVSDPVVTDGDTGYLEFMLGVELDPGYTGGALYIDNVRTEVLFIDPAFGDMDGDADVDASDIDLLWQTVRGAPAPPDAWTTDLNSDGFVNEDDVDYLLANYLDAGANRQYGDADLDGGVGGLDYTRWRNRAGTGWANGDFDGDGGVGGLDYTLWRTRPTAYPTTVGPHAGGLAAVPEPSSFLLMGLAGLALVGLSSRRLGR